MTDGVYESFQRIIENRYLKGDIELVCYDEQGNVYEGFVFLATRSRRSWAAYTNQCNSEST